MRIAIDYRILSLLPAWRTRGIPRYTQQQVREVLRLDHENEYLLLTPLEYLPEQILPEIRSAPNVSFRVLPGSSRVPDQEPPSVPHLALRQTEQFQTWLMRERVDVFHSPTPWFHAETVFPAIEVCPTVTALYDLIPLLFPEEFGADETFWQRMYGMLPWATRLLSISEFTRQDAVRVLNIPASRIDVAYPMADPAYRVLAPEEVERRLASLRAAGLPKGFLLTVTFVGGATKNVELLVRAYAALPPSLRREYPLVIVGHFGPPRDAVVRGLMDQLGVSDTVIITGVISDDLLAALYNAATLVAIASRYEGFGMPLLEAMQCGAPAIASTASSMPEVVGTAGIVVPPDEPAGFTHAIAEVIESRARQEQMREAGFIQARRFSPEQLGRATLECYARAAGRAPDSHVPAANSETSAITVSSAPSMRRIAVWSHVPPRVGEAARRGWALVEGLAPHADLELFVGDDELPAPALMKRYRVHHYSAFDRRHRQAPFDALIFQPDASALSTAVEQAALRHHDLLTFGTSNGNNQVRPGVRDPLGLRPDLERELARASLGVSAGTFVLGLVGEFTSNGSGGPLDAVLDAIGALTRRLLDVQVVVGCDADRRIRRWLESHVRAGGLHRHVLWVTPHTVDQADDYLLACDAVVSVADATPTQTLANALAAGRAVVAVGPIWPCVSDEACWHLSGNSTSAAIEEALITIALTPGHRAAMEQAARKCFEQHFTLSAMADAYCAAIDETRAAKDGLGADPQVQVADNGQLSPRPFENSLPTQPLRFNKACELEDFAHPDLDPLMREMRDASAGPSDAEPGAWDRKQWEVAMAIRTLRAFGAVRPDANLLGVAAGMEDTIYHLAPLVREMTVVDRYLQPGQWDAFAAPWMTVAPEFGARVQPGHSASASAGHVRVTHMDARRLQFADNTFDGIFSSGSIEHVGGLNDIAHAAYEMGRVLKHGGVLSISTELLMRGPAEPDVALSGNMILLRPSQICRYIIEASGLEPVDDFVTDISPATAATRQAIGHAFGVHAQGAMAAGVRAAAWTERLWSRPYLVLEHDGYLFGSVHVALRKTSAYPSPSNQWARPDAALINALVPERRELVSALGGWGAAVPSLAPRRPGTGRMAQVVAVAEKRAHETYVMCHAARETMAAWESEMRRIEVELPSDERAAAAPELARLREEVRRLATRTAEIERRALGWRMLLRGFFTLLTPMPEPVATRTAPDGFRGRLLSVARAFRPIARRVPRLSAYVSRWIYGS